MVRSTLPISSHYRKEGRRAHCAVWCGEILVWVSCKGSETERFWSIDPRAPGPHPEVRWLG